MKKKIEPLKNPQGRQGISRREMMQTLVGAASGVIIAPAVAFPQSAEGQSISPALVAEESATMGEWTPLFLDPHQKESLIVLAEIIVPGSTKADVTRFVDLLLSVDTVENRAKFIASLSAIDGESLRRYDAPFRNLTAARQTELVAIASKAAPGQTSDSETSHAADAATASGILNSHFEYLKALVSKAYYSSEIGMRELGWSDSYFYETFPGCQGVTS